MIVRVIEAGRVYEVITPERARIDRGAEGEARLVIPADESGEGAECLTPHAAIRAAKDRLLGLGLAGRHTRRPVEDPAHPLGDFSEVATVAPEPLPRRLAPRPSRA